MREFFKPCRRKFGVVTLLMACVFTAGWVRSTRVNEVASVLMSRRAQLFIKSDNGIVEFGRFLGHEPNYFSTQPTTRWVQYDEDQHNSNPWAGISWRCRFSNVGIAGFSEGANPNGARYESFIWTCPRNVGAGLGLYGLLELNG